MKRLLKTLWTLKKWFERAEDRLVTYSLEELKDGDVIEGARVAEIAIRFAQVRSALENLHYTLARSNIMYDSGEEVELTRIANDTVN